ncbi:MAG TPA: glycosyltransferase [Ignavibacteriaceae bacterium]|nr:glycosyltransferase [Ignavibacteriaceae bacterium]
MLKILHLAPQNYAGVPYDYYKMHNSVGDFSRLITYHKNQRDFPEDICLNLPLPDFSIAKSWRKKKVTDKENRNVSETPLFFPGNIFERYYFDINDKLKRKKIDEVIEKYHLNDFEIIHYDAGLDFYRYPEQAMKWKKQGKKIVCCYYGSDLRIRGIIKELDEISDLNITSEFDHLKMKKDLHYLFYPYDASELPVKPDVENEVISVVHSPTNRKYKGTDLIISVIDKIKKEKKINFILMENRPRSEVLKVKSESDICIDQVGGTMGGTGYGKAGLESLAMGVPTITNMTKEYSDWLPENPFIIANNEAELYKRLIDLIENKSLRKQSGDTGKKWVKKYHSFESVDSRLKELYKKKNII